MPWHARIKKWAQGPTLRKHNTHKYTNTYKPHTKHTQIHTNTDAIEKTKTNVHNTDKYTTHYTQIHKYTKRKSEDQYIIYANTIRTNTLTHTKDIQSTETQTNAHKHTHKHTNKYKHAQTNRIQHTLTNIPKAHLNAFERI